MKNVGIKYEELPRKMKPQAKHMKDQESHEDCCKGIFEQQQKRHH